MKGLKEKEIEEELRSIFFGEVFKASTIYNWVKKFKNNEINVLDKQKKMLKRKLAEENKEKIENKILKNRRISSNEISHQLNIGKSTVLDILKLLGIFNYFFFILSIHSRI